MWVCFVLWLSLTAIKGHHFFSREEGSHVCLTGFFEEVSQANNNENRKMVKSKILRKKIK